MNIDVVISRWLLVLRLLLCWLLVLRLLLCWLLVLVSSLHPWS